MIKNVVYTVIKHHGLFGPDEAAYESFVRAAVPRIEGGLRGRVLNQELAAQISQAVARDPDVRHRMSQVQHTSPAEAGALFADAFLKYADSSRHDLVSQEDVSFPAWAAVPLAESILIKEEEIIRYLANIMESHTGEFYDIEKIQSLVRAYDVDGTDGSHWLMEFVTRGQRPFTGYTITLTNPRGRVFEIGSGDLLGNVPGVDRQKFLDAVDAACVGDQSIYDLQEGKGDGYVSMSDEELVRHFADAYKRGSGVTRETRRELRQEIERRGLCPYMAKMGKVAQAEPKKRVSRDSGYRHGLSDSTSPNPLLLNNSNRGVRESWEDFGEQEISARAPRNLIGPPAGYNPPISRRETDAERHKRYEAAAERMVQNLERLGKSFTPEERKQRKQRAIEHMHRMYAQWHGPKVASPKHTESFYSGAPFSPTLVERSPGSGPYVVSRRSPLPPGFVYYDDGFQLVEDFRGDFARALAVKAYLDDNGLESWGSRERYSPEVEIRPSSIGRVPIPLMESIRRREFLERGGTGGVWRDGQSEDMLIPLGGSVQEAPPEDKDRFVDRGSASSPSAPPEDQLLDFYGSEEANGAGDISELGGGGAMSAAFETRNRYRDMELGRRPQTRDEALRSIYARMRRNQGQYPPSWTESDEEGTPNQAPADDSDKRGMTLEKKKMIIQFIKDTPNPDEDDVQELAQKLGLTVDQVERVIYGYAHQKSQETGDEKKEGVESVFPPEDMDEWRLHLGRRWRKIRRFGRSLFSRSAQRRAGLRRRRLYASVEDDDANITEARPRAVLAGTVGAIRRSSVLHRKPIRGRARPPKVRLQSVGYDASPQKLLGECEKGMPGNKAMFHLGSISYGSLAPYIAGALENSLSSERADAVARSAEAILVQRRKRLMGYEVSPDDIHEIVLSCLKDPEMKVILRSDNTSKSGTILGDMMDGVIRGSHDYVTEQEMPPGSLGGTEYENYIDAGPPVNPDFLPRLSPRVIDLLQRNGWTPSEALQFGYGRLLSLGWTPKDIWELRSIHRLGFK